MGWLEIEQVKDESQHRHLKKIDTGNIKQAESQGFVTSFRVDKLQGCWPEEMESTRFFFCDLRWCQPKHSIVYIRKFVLYITFLLPSRLVWRNLYNWQHYDLFLHTLFVQFCFEGICFGDFFDPPSRGRKRRNVCRYWEHITTRKVSTWNLKMDTWNFWRFLFGKYEKFSSSSR